jgi:hypothetical protein
MHTTRRLFGGFLALIAFGYTHVAHAWTHQAIYGWYPSCALAATVRSRLAITPSDLAFFGPNTRTRWVNTYYRYNVSQNIDNDGPIIIDPSEVMDETVYLAFHVLGVQVSTIPDHLDGQWSIHSFAIVEYWNCEPWGEPFCWWIIVGPDDGSSQDAEGPIDP